MREQSLASLLRRLAGARVPALYGVSANAPAHPRPAQPALFLKPFAAALLARRPRSCAVAAAPDEELRHEFCLAVLIGRGGAALAPDALDAHAAAYFLVDDITRHPPAADTPVCLRKLAPAVFSAPLAPAELGAAAELRVEAAARREAAAGRVAEQHYALGELAAFLSRRVALQPGDVLMGGAVAHLRVRPNERVSARLLAGERELLALALRVRLTANAGA